MTIAGAKMGAEYTVDTSVGVAMVGVDLTGKGVNTVVNPMMVTVSITIDELCI